LSNQFSRDELVARMVRAGELEVSGESPDELREYFAPGYVFHGPGGVEMDVDGLLDYFAAVRAAFDHRSIRRGIIIAEGNNMACQTWIEGDFTQEFGASPVGPLQPNGKRITFDLHNIFQFDDQGRFIMDSVRYDNWDVLHQMGYLLSTDNSGARTALEQ
jgi:predicted ester cyclase